MAAPFDLTAALTAAQADWLARVVAVRAAYAAGKPLPPSPSTPLIVTAKPNDSAVTLAGQKWVVQSGVEDAVAIAKNGTVYVHAKAGERASFDPPRKIRAELCGQRRYAKGEAIALSGTITVDPASVIAGADWCSVIQIHQADTRRADGNYVLASPLFSADLMLDAAGAPLLRIRGETGTGLQPAFSPLRVLGAAPFAFGVDHSFEMPVLDGHGGPGRIRFVLDGKVVCDFTGPTGYEYVDLLATLPNGKTQLTGSYLKAGIYAGKDAGDQPPAGVSVAFKMQFAG